MDLDRRTIYYPGVQSCIWIGLDIEQAIRCRWLDCFPGGRVGWGRDNMGWVSPDQNRIPTALAGIPDDRRGLIAPGDGCIVVCRSACLGA